MKKLRNGSIRAIVVGLFSVLLLFILAGCGGGGASSSTTATNNANAQQQEQAAQPRERAAEQTTEPEMPKHLGEVIFALPVDTITYAPLFVAMERGYFEDEGVSMKVISVEGTGPAVQALVGGSVQFISLDPGGVMNGVSKGIDYISIASMVNRLTMDFVLRNEVIERTGVTPESPIEDRFNVLKGLTIGITSAGSPTDLFTRYYLDQANLEPEKDTKLLAIGAGPSLVAALKQGQIDGFMLGAPVPQVVEAEGVGKIMMSGTSGEVPGLDRFDYLSLTTRKSYLEENEEIVRGVARAFARANNYILDNPEGTIEILQKRYDTVDLEILKSSFESVKRAIERDGKMSEESWSNSLNIYKKAGIVTEDIDIQEGVLWTNKYVNDVNGMSE